MIFLIVKTVWKYLVRALLLWIVFWFMCRPLILIHYSAEAPDAVVYFLDDGIYTTHEEIQPGSRDRYFGDMFPEADFSITFSLPYSSRDGFEIYPPFSRIDIYVDADARIERTEVSQNFFARFAWLL